MFIFAGVKSIEILCILGVVAVTMNYLVSISFVPAALSLYAEVGSFVANKQLFPCKMFQNDSPTAFVFTCS